MKNFDTKNNDCHAALAMTKSVQSGRSMIEMLGVLAIIGVLSVGGIAGYSKAMMKYRINKTIEQITLIAGNIHSFFAPQGNYEGLDNKKVIKKAKLVPDEMWNGENIENIFGGGFSMSKAVKNDNDINNGSCPEGYCNKAFYIMLTGIPQEACVELVSQDWKASGVTYIQTDDGEEVYSAIDNFPISIDRAITMCQMIDGGANEAIFLRFHALPEGDNALFLGNII